MRAGVLFVLVLLTTCEPTGGSALDAGLPDSGCELGCHWDCFGGSECVDGKAWVNAFAPRECCHYDDPWPDPGPVCSVWHFPCSGAACAAPDPRYRLCVDNLQRRVPCLGDCEQLRLLCAVEGAAKTAGAACHDDLDCRPAAEGVVRLRCDGNTCVDDVRPAPPADYGARCGLPDDYEASLVGEGAISTTAASCDVCQVARAAGGCLRQACTLRCTYDEDCPAGSICLCSDVLEVGNYCAAATDRDTPEGRAAGLAACP